MIDKNGNKIILQNNDQDTDFLLKEISFYMKAFKNEQNDPRALIIARKIKLFLKASDQIAAVMDTLTAMEEYSALTNSEDFLWELIYARRELADKQMKNDDWLTAAEHRRIEATHFGTIVRIKPSVSNRCAEVIELVIAEKYYVFADADDTASDILDYAQELYENIPETESEKYYVAGENLYLDVIKYSKKLKQDDYAKFQTYLKLIHSSRGLFLINNNITSLKWLALAYIGCFSYKYFCFNDEKENINEVVSWLKKNIPTGGNRLESILNALNEKIMNHQG